VTDEPTVEPTARLSAKIAPARSGDNVPVSSGQPGPAFTAKDRQDARELIRAFCGDDLPVSTGAVLDEVERRINAEAVAR
jgi:hypothetical protein